MTAAREMVATRETYGRTLLTMAEDYQDIVVLGGRPERVHLRASVARSLPGTLL